MMPSRLPLASVPRCTQNKRSAASALRPRALTLPAFLPASSRPHRVARVDVLLVQAALALGEAAAHDVLDLGGQLLLHVALQAPQQEGPQHAVQARLGGK